MPVLILQPHAKIPEEYVNDLIDEKDMVLFQNGISEVIHFIKENPGSKEEPLKYKLRDLLTSLYKGQYLVAVPPSGYNADLQIYDGINESAPISVIIETKRPDAPKNEMIFLSKDKKSCNLNIKAFHELIGYYLDFQEQKRQNPIHQLIATNGDDWFIFSEDEFHKYVFKDKEIRELHHRFKDDRKRFYEELAKKSYLYDEYNWEVIHFKLTDFVKDLTKDAKKVSKAFFSLFKLLSPYVLLGKELPSNDGNVLNKKFYHELLHILGLYEVEKDNKELGLKKRTIRRLPEDKREPGSLIENTLAQMRDKDVNFYEHDYSEYGDTHDDQKFNIALDLCLSWLNRILFIKLLEGQLLRYGKLKEKFMTWEKVASFNEIDHLFFKVFKYPVAEREAHINEKYANIPYLNSSLFDKTTLEEQFLSISNLDGTIDIAYYPTTVLTKEPGRKINCCRYLLEFLDKYDFSSDQSKIFKNTDNDKLINASVLGLIFEKINAYADGAVFTPGLITSYICRETIRRAVVKKFNESELPGAGKFETIADIKNTLRNEPQYRGTFANNIINSLRICDPAVGSGHFLVSALNELILIKSELGVLQDNNGYTLEVDAKIANDELIFIDERGNQFRYDPDNWKSQIIQQTIFNEKLMIITKCLYGVDLNPKSVSICRLRLWIELLKHAYYKPEPGKNVASNVLQVLPNIDINIRCGNSLISHYPLDYPYEELVKSEIVPEIDIYRKSNEEYRLAADRNIKLKIKHELDGVAIRCKAKQGKEDALKNNLAKCQKELDKLSSTKLLTEWIGETDDKSEKKKKIAELKKKVKAAETALTEYQSNEEKQAAFSNAFEWRLAFPDILDTNGDFVGFDCVIGNPPYIQLQKINDEFTKGLYKEKFATYEAMGDIYCLFYEQGRNLLKENGILGYITSNKWMHSEYGQKLKDFFAEKTNPLILIDFTGNKIFDDVTVSVNVLIFTKAPNIGKTTAISIASQDSLDINNILKQKQDNTINITDNNWLIFSSDEQQIIEKIKQTGTPLNKWDITIYRGVVHGCKDAFEISGEKRLEILNNCLSEEERIKTNEIIRPFVKGSMINRYGFIDKNLWLLTLFPSKKYDIEKLPAIKQHLLSIGIHKLEQTGKEYTINNQIISARKKTNNAWFETQDSIAYWNEFNKEKLVWTAVNSEYRFSILPPDVYFNNSLFMITGKSLNVLCGILNSTLYQFYFKIVISSGAYQYGSKHIFKDIPVINTTNQYTDKIAELVDKLHNSINPEDEKIKLIEEIDSAVYNLYNISDIEKEVIIKSLSN